MKTVVIIGAGFGGLNAAKILSKNKNLNVILVDKLNHHLFKPLLYQVATAGLDESDIAYPIRSIFRRNGNVQVIKDEVVSLKLENNLVITKEKEIRYDYLLVSVGASENYFGHDEWKRYAPTLKNLYDALNLRNRILNAFEKAEKCNDEKEKKKFLTFVVVGGGPTGVELAGAIGEMTRYTLAKDFRSIDPTLSRVILIEAGKKILPSFNDKLINFATRSLESLGVQVWTNSLVTDINEDGVRVGDEFIETATVIWAAGVKGNPLLQNLPCEKDRNGRIIVNEYLNIDGFENAFFIGDCVHFEQDGKALPGIAPVAIQMGKYAAKTILSELNKNDRKPFRYFDKGQMATIGRSKAVAEIWGMKFKGFTAWLLWIFVHIMYLTGFKNKVFVMLQWAWSYFTLKKGARIIIDRD